MDPVRPCKATNHTGRYRASWFSSRCPSPAIKSHARVQLRLWKNLPAGLPMAETPAHKGTPWQIDCTMARDNIALTDRTFFADLVTSSLIDGAVAALNTDYPIYVCSFIRSIEGRQRNRTNERHDRDPGPNHRPAIICHYFRWLGLAQSVGFGICCVKSDWPVVGTYRSRFICERHGAFLRREFSISLGWRSLREDLIF